MTYKTFLLVLITALVVCQFFVVDAAHADDGIAMKIQDAYSKLKSFEATFEQKLLHKESGSVETRKGKLLFQKPLLIRWTTEKPKEELIIVNDQEIWDYIPQENLAYVYPPDALGDTNGIIPVVTGQTRLQQDFKVKVAGKEDDLTKLVLYPKDPGPQMVEATIWVDGKTGLIRRAASQDFYGNVNEVRFTTFKPGVKISPNQFNFKAPAGTEVEDRRQKGF